MLDSFFIFYFYYYLLFFVSSYQCFSEHFLTLCHIHDRDEDPLGESLADIFSVIFRGKIIIFNFHRYVFVDYIRNR